MSEIVNTEPKKFYLLDLDRCMLNTPLASDVYADVIREVNPDLAAAMLKSQQDTEDVGGSFDIIEFLSPRASLEEIEIFDTLFIEKARDMDLLNPGGIELLQALDDHDANYGILTYGHEKWQTVKLQASQLDKIPYFITPDKHKGWLMRSWLQPDGRFRLPTELLVPHDELSRDADGDVDTTSINLGERALFDVISQSDDKAVSFEEIPERVEGYWYQKSDRLLPSQRGTVPSRIRVVRHLAQIVEFEFGSDIPSAA